MPLLPFNLSTLVNLDHGRIARAFDVEMMRLINDIDDRPLEKKARKVAVVFSITPDLSSGSPHIDSTSVTGVVKTNIPDRSTPPIKMKIRKMNGDFTLAFQPESPDAPDQMTINDALEGQRQARKTTDD